MAPRSRSARGGLLRIGEAAFVGHHSTLAARSEVRIGARTFLAELVSVRDHDHDPAHPPSAGTTLIDPVYVGDDCWLAAKVTVTHGVTIGNHTVVGAHAVVTRDLPSDVVAVGVPASSRTTPTGSSPHHLMAETPRRRCRAIASAYTC